MFQFDFFRATSLSVTEITRYISNVFDADEVLQNIWVTGEVSNLSKPGSGHIYFTLKDASASLRCVIWKSNTAAMQIALMDGIALEAHGYIGVYERSGQYQLYVDKVRPAGEGFLYQEFMRLKKRLEAEGLFDLDRKRPLPAYPRKIGIVTSPTGAALQDILNTLNQRYRLAELILSPCQVQGSDAASQIIAAVQRLNDEEEPDLIIMARGGGSLEDLFAFNDEGVVRAIVSSRAPVVTGIGHETDFTLADFASDVRAPTPTGAAIAAVPDSLEIASDLRGLTDQLQKTILSILQYCSQNFKALMDRLERTSPMRNIDNDRQQLDDLDQYLLRLMTHKTSMLKLQLKGRQVHLSALNPYSVLNRGYAIVSHESGDIVRSIQQVDPDDRINIKISDGSFGAVVSKDKKGLN